MVKHSEEIIPSRITNGYGTVLEENTYRKDNKPASTE